MQDTDKMITPDDTLAHLSVTRAGASRVFYRHGLDFCCHGQVSLRDASLTLLDSSDGFRDLLGPTQLTGTFTAVHDPRRCRQLHYAISQLVTDALGRSRFVRSHQPSGVNDPT